MKLYDEVKLIKDKKEYNREGVFKDRVGRIWSGEIRDNYFLVMFIDERFKDENYIWTEKNIKTIEKDIIIPIKIIDLEVVKENNATDDEILEDLPLNNPKWWCKVEDGYILNLLGEKKNKIPYDYNS